MLLAKGPRIADTLQYEDNDCQAKQGASDRFKDEQNKWRKRPHSKGDRIFDRQCDGEVFGADILRLVRRDSGCFYALDLLLAARGGALGQWSDAGWFGAKASHRVDASL